MDKALRTPVIAGNWKMNMNAAQTQELLSAMLIPASEIKAVTAGVMAGQAAARQRNAPARPPIPDNF